jgi:hypothetical protein
MEKIRVRVTLKMILEANEVAESENEAKQE